MAHLCSYFSEVTLHGDEIVNEVTALYCPKKGKPLKELVYEEHEDGTNCCRYLYRASYAGGYLVLFPGETQRSCYYGDFTQISEPLSDCKRLGIFPSWPNKEKELEYIAKVRPELKYLIKKFLSSGCNKPTYFIDLVIRYKEDPSIESLVEKKLFGVALDKRLTRLSKKKRMEVVNFIKNKNNYPNSISLSQILFCIKHNIEPTQNNLWFYGEYHYNFKMANYFANHVISKWQYSDYINMCKRLNKNLKDDYWAYPNDFHKAHDKVMKEINRLEKAKKKKEIENIYKIGNFLKENNKKIGDYDIYIPSKYDDIEKQANILKQCLITASYDKKVSDLKSVLVFIRKDGNPIATAEIDYNKSLKQFYADEHDHQNCKPTKEVKSIFEQWLASAVIKKPNLAML